jgi:hypothetical protein
LFFGLTSFLSSFYYYPKTIIPWLNLELLERKLLQQISSPPSLLRKGLLIIGAILMISSFFFFYQASVKDWHYHSGTHYSINSATWGPAQYSFGSVYEDNVQSLIMNQNDSMTIHSSESHFDNAELFNQCRVVLKADNGTIIAQSPDVVMDDGFVDLESSHPGVLSFTNYGSPRRVDIIVTFPLVDNLTDILNYQNYFGYGLVYVTYDHYGPPDWLWFAGGVILASIGLVTASVLASLLTTLQKALTKRMHEDKDAEEKVEEIFSYRP